VWEFCQICNFGTVGHKGKLIGFLDEQVKGQGHCKSTYGQISTSGAIFSLVSRMHVRMLMKFVRVTYYQVHMTLVTFSRSWLQRSWLQRSRSQTTTCSLPRSHDTGDIFKVKVQRSWVQRSRSQTTTCSLPRSHDTGDIFKVMASKVTDNIFQECTVWQRHMGQRFTVADHLVHVQVVVDGDMSYTCFRCARVSMCIVHAVCQVPKFIFH